MKIYKTKWSEILTKEFLIKEYVINRKSSYQIALEVGCNQLTILNYLRKYNIKIRTKSESHKGRHHTKESKQKIGEKFYNFKGRVKDGQGYILIYSPDHPNKDKNNYMRESRLNIEKEIGRPLDPNWVVHHIDKIRDNNKPRNLICFVSQSAHRKFHINPNNIKKSEIIFDGRNLL